MVAPIAIGTQIASSIFSGISSYKSAKSKAKQVKAQAKLEAQQVLDNAHDVMQEQKMLASGGGYILDQNTNPLEIMLDTEKRAKQYANQIIEIGNKEARSIKKAGRNSAIGSALGGAANIAGMF